MARTMRQIDLVEYQASESFALSVAERDALKGVLPSVSIQPVPGENGTYTLTPSSTVGAVEIGELSVLIKPKIGIPQLLSLACYAVGQIKFQREDFNFPENPELPDVLALALHTHARRAFAAGLLHGYRTEEAALYGVRGRIRFDDHLRRRFGVAVPVEVRYDEFTDDILANQLMKAAVVRLGGMRLRSKKARIGLGWVAAMLDNVTMREFPARNVPEVTFNRLNGHYREVVALSRLVLRNSAFQSRRGEVRAQGFLMDMNKVFQEFVTVALREKLELSPSEFGERRIDSLDKKGAIELKPDLVWSRGPSYLFVGDAKYKRIDNEQVRNADLYQLLAYATALNLPGGLLIYAKGERETATYQVRHCGKRLEVAALDLEDSLEDVLERVRGIAERVRALADNAGRGFPPAPE